MFLIGDTCSQHMLEVSARSSPRSIVLRKVYAKCTRKVSPSYETKRIAKQTSGQKQLLEKKPEGDSSFPSESTKRIHVYTRYFRCNDLDSKALKTRRVREGRRREGRRREGRRGEGRRGEEVARERHPRERSELCRSCEKLRFY